MNNIKKSILIEWISSDNLGIFTGDVSELEGMKKNELIKIWERIKDERKKSPIMS